MEPLEFLFCLFLLSLSVMPNSFVTSWTVAHQAPLCPWDFPGKNTGMGCHFLLQGIFPTQGSNPHFLHLLHWETDFFPLHQLGSSLVPIEGTKLKPPVVAASEKGPLPLPSV